MPKAVTFKSITALFCVLLLFITLGITAVAANPETAQTGSTGNSLPASGSPAVGAEAGPAGETPSSETETAPEDDVSPAQSENDASVHDSNEPEEATEPEHASSAAVSEEEVVGAEVLQPHLFEVDAASVIVTTYAELDAALSGDNSYTTVYLGNDITATAGGIIINKNKPSVVIDGHPPGAAEGVTNTFTQYTSADLTNTIRLEGGNSTTKTVRLQNINVTGGNYYGIVMVPETLKGVTVVYENMSYTGPQPSYNRGGASHYINSSFTLVQRGSPVQELAEANSVAFGGNVTVHSAATTDAVLWLTGGSPSLTLLDNANVTIDTVNYFIYSTTPTVTIGQNASLRLTNNNGFTSGTQRIGTLTIQQSGRLDIVQNAASANGSLRIASLLQMELDSSLSIQRTGTDGAAIRFPDSNGKAVFNNPRSVLLYSPSSRPIHFSNGGSLSILTGSLNVWKTATTTTLVDASLDNMPTHFWNRTGNALLNLAANYNTDTQTGFTHNLSAEDPVAAELNGTNFKLNAIQLLAFGSFPLSINTVMDNSTSVTGNTLGGAALQLSFQTASADSKTANGTAGTNGVYSLSLGGAYAAAGSRVSVLAGSGLMRKRDTAIVQDSTLNRLSFLSVPSVLPFQTTRVPGTSTLIPREEEGFTITVSDTRPQAAPWRLDASVPKPLTAETSNGTFTLPGALVYVDGQGNKTPLNEQPLTIHSEQSAQNGQFSIQWAERQGILLWLLPGEAYSNVNYHTSIHWSLIDAP